MAVSHDLISASLAGRTSTDIDFYIVRENVECEYFEIGGVLYRSTENEMVVQESVFTRHGVDRIMKYAVELAQTRPKKHLTSATKSNGIIHTMPFWDDRFAPMYRQYPEIKTTSSTSTFCARTLSSIRTGLTSSLVPIFSVTSCLSYAPQWPASLGSRRRPTLTRTRIGARHCRQRHCQPDWSGLVGCYDAGTSSSLSD